MISANTLSPEACYRWISFLSRNPSVTFNMPARQSLLTEPAFVASQTADALAFFQSYAESLRSPNLVVIPNTFSNALSYDEFVLQSWLNRAFDRYVINGADLETELAQAEAFTREFQACIIENLSTSNSEYELSRDCAINIDPTMESRFN